MQYRFALNFGSLSIRNLFLKGSRIWVPLAPLTLSLCLLCSVIDAYRVAFNIRAMNEIPGVVYMKAYLRIATGIPTLFITHTRKVI